MFYRVFKLRANGKRIPRFQIQEEHGLVGEVLVTTDSRRGEPIRFAHLIDKGYPIRPGIIIARLERPEIITMTRKGMLIKGIEINTESQEMVQEWLCKPLPEKE